MKQLYPLIAVAVLFVALMLVFRFWIDTRVIVATNCKHSVETTARLAWKTQVGACYWFVEGDDQVSEHWFNCDNNEVDEVVPWSKAVYTCE